MINWDEKCIPEVIKFDLESEFRFEDFLVAEFLPGNLVQGRVSVGVVHAQVGRLARPEQDTISVRFETPVSRYWLHTLSFNGIGKLEHIPWSSLVEGDEQLDQLNQQSKCMFRENIKNYLDLVKPKRLA